MDLIVVAVVQLLGYNNQSEQTMTVLTRAITILLKSLTYVLILLALYQVINFVLQKFNRKATNRKTLAENVLSLLGTIYFKLHVLKSEQ